MSRLLFFITLCATLAGALGAADPSRSDQCVNAPIDTVRITDRIEAAQIFRSAGRLEIAGELVADDINLIATEWLIVEPTAKLIARRADGRGGRITLNGHALCLDGMIDASGTTGGQIIVSGDHVLHHGTLTAAGTSGIGGDINITGRSGYSAILKSGASVNGAVAAGSLRIWAPSGRLFTSGTLTATGDHGGTLELFGDDLALVGSTLDASGEFGGGTVRVGGCFQGRSTPVANSSRVTVSGSAQLLASAKRWGDGGEIVVWSDGSTDFAGSAIARGGIDHGDGGCIEISGKLSLAHSGSADAGAPNGHRGHLLLDPKNITVQNAPAGVLPQYQLTDPNPSAGNGFGDNVRAVGPGNRNLVITSISADVGAANSGAAYLFDSITGALIGQLVGSNTFDFVAGDGVKVLSNGNFVIRSVSWHSGAASAAGAVTWGSGVSGVSGVVSAANSIVGASANDGVGTFLDLIAGGNFIVRVPNWDNGAATDAGAVTWGDGTSGTAGVVSAANSLVGASMNDSVGSGGLTILSNGNYVVRSHLWDNGAAVDAGAVTWCNGLTGTVGAVSMANSLVGSVTGDGIGAGGVFTLANSNYVVVSPYWDNTALVGDAGAVTWCNGSGGTVGAVSAANSLVGTKSGDLVGNAELKPLANGNYVVRSVNWDAPGPINEAGAVTWGNGLGGTVGAVSSANSIVGSSANDNVGNYGLTELSNGNFVVRSDDWNNGAATRAGAVTWCNGLGGTAGVVAAANSLVGSHVNDSFGNGGVVKLTNGNYVVSSKFWSNGVPAVGGNAGAVTWCSGLGGTVGLVSTSNSLTGAKADDLVGAGGVTALSNGNYVVSSPMWDSTGPISVGAVTWCNGLGGTTGLVAAGNSVVGSTANDNVGTTQALANGNYVVRSPSWDNGAATDAGAVRWCNGAGGTVGVVSTANSLVGSTSNDQVGGHLTPLANGNYLVLNQSWDRAGVVDAGAVTWGNGLGGTVGVITTANSLVGSTAGDAVGTSGDELPNGNYLLRSPSWDGPGPVVDAGALTWINGLGGTVGVLSASNSLVGSQAGDGVASFAVLSNGNYVALTPNWLSGTGAATWCNGATGRTGAISSANSLVGPGPGSLVGNPGIVALTNGNYLVRSTACDVTANNAGAITWGNGSVGTFGVVSVANSLVGSTSNDFLGTGPLVELPGGNVVCVCDSWDGVANDSAALVWINGTTGESVSGYGSLSAQNSLLGTLALTTVTATSDQPVDGAFVATFTAGGTTVVLVGLPSPNLLTYGRATGQSMTVTPAFITRVLETGTDVTLQASNDITITDAIVTNNAGGNGGHLTLKAGRSILINANIDTDNGALTLEANTTLADGVIDADRAAGNADITTAGGVTILTGSANCTAILRNGAAKTNSAAGAITLSNVTANVLVIDTVTTATLTGTITGSVTATGNLVLQSTATLVLGLEGVGAGNFDTVSVTGTLTINNAALTLNRTFAYSNQVLVIGPNDGADAIIGTFAGLPENALIDTGGGIFFRVSYVGGNGNDLQLTASGLTGVGSVIGPADLVFSTGQTLDFTVTFNQAVTGVDASDFALSTTGIAGAFVSNVTPAGPSASYTVTVNTGAGVGTLRLDVLDDDTILGGGSIPLGGPGVGNGTFTGGAVYTISKRNLRIERGALVANGATDDVGRPAAGIFSVFTYTAKNTSTGVLTLSGTPTSQNESNCSVTVGAPGSLILNGVSSTTFALTIRPTLPGRFSAEIRIASDETLYRFFIAGIAGAQVAELRVERLPGVALTGGMTDPLGQALIGSPTSYVYTLRNTGGSTLAINSATLTSPINTSAASITSALAPTVAVGNSTTLTVSLTPLGAGSFGASLSITTSAGVFALTLSGTATAAVSPEIEMWHITALTSTAILDNGNRNIGAVSVGAPTTITLAVVNSGTSTLNLTASSMLSSATNCTTRIIVDPATSIPANGGTTNCVVELTPMAAGACSVLLQIFSTDADEAVFDVTLSSSGQVPALELRRPQFVPLASGSTDSMGATIVYYPASYRDVNQFTVTYSIANTGTGTLTLFAQPTITAATNCVVSVVPLGALTINAGSTASVQILVTPGQPGTFSFNVSVVSDDPASPLYTLTTTGIFTFDDGTGGCSVVHSRTADPTPIALLLICLTALACARIQRLSSRDTLRCRASGPDEHGTEGGTTPVFAP